MSNCDLCGTKLHFWSLVRKFDKNVEIYRFYCPDCWKNKRKEIDNLEINGGEEEEEEEEEEDTWLCNYCDEEFETYQEAAKHEKKCSGRFKIKRQRFIKIGIHFGLKQEQIIMATLPSQLPKSKDGSIIIPEGGLRFPAGSIKNIGQDEEIWFDFFNRIRLDRGHEKEWCLPEGVNLEREVEIIEGHKVYKRSKKFTMKLSNEGFNISFKKYSFGIPLKKMSRDTNLVSFIPETDYSPLELAKDILFLGNFSEIFVRRGNMKHFRSTAIYKNENKIFVRTRDNVLECEYPLEERIKLYKRDRELDNFIFKDDLNELKKIKEKQLRKEVLALFKKVMSSN